MAMFAVVPLIVIGYWIGIGGVAIIGGFVLSIIAWKVTRWFKKDPNKDMVIFMGPPRAGKSELLASVMGEAFNPKREMTGFEFKKKGVKDFVVCDSGGDGNNIKFYTDRIMEYVKGKRPDFILVILVTNVQKLLWSGLPAPDGTEVPPEIDKLAEYLDFFTMTCEEKTKAEGKIDKLLCENYFTERYDNGHWAYAIIGTHRAQMDEATIESGLANLTGHFDQYSRKMRYVGAGIFELSERKERISTVCFIKKLLEMLHTS